MLGLKITATVIGLIMTSSTVFAQNEDHTNRDGAKEYTAKYAADLGYDLSTEAGRKQFGNFARTKVESIAKEQNIDLSAAEGKKKINEYLEANGQQALIPPPQPERDKEMNRELNAEKSNGSNQDKKDCPRSENSNQEKNQNKMQNKSKDQNRPQKD